MRCVVYLFFKIPRIYCNECESYELPYCAHCGEALTYNRKGVLECSCDAPLRVTCAEQHRSCEIKPWFLPKDRLVNAINKNILQLQGKVRKSSGNLLNKE